MRVIVNFLQVMGKAMRSKWERNSATWSSQTLVLPGLHLFLRLMAAAFVNTAYRISVSHMISVLVATWVSSDAISKHM